MNSSSRKKRIAIVTGVVLAFLAGMGINELFRDTPTGLKSSYLGDSSISCARTCPDGSTIDAEQSCPDSSISQNYCGDGSIQSPNASGQYEQCDDGNSEDADTCTNQCVWYTNYAFDTTNSWDNTDNNADANNDTCNNRMAQCGTDSFNPCETGVSSLSDSEATSWTCTLKDRE